MSAWQKFRIGSLGRVVTGKTPTSKKPELFGSVYPFITPSDLEYDRPSIKTERFLSRKGKDSQSRLLLPKGAVCFTCIGATIGKLCMTTSPSFTNQQINSIVIDDTEHDPRFVFYLLRERYGEIAATASGAATPIVNKTSFSNFELDLPPFPLQRKIASILSAYDDLIENNTRRIAILEEMAQAIHREWFVHFRFPGHENVNLVDSPLGQIPEDWEVGTLNDMCESVNDGDWIETKDQGGNDYRLLQVSNVGTASFRETGKYRYITQETFERLRCQEVMPGDLLISRMPTPIGRAWLATEMPWRIVTAVDVAIAKPDSSVAGRYYLLCYLNSERHLGLAGQHATGTTRPRISRRSLCGIQTLIPPSELQFVFDKCVQPVFELANVLEKRNGNLRTTRDLLLPKLISGKLDVEQLDIDVGLTTDAMEEATA